MRANVSAISFLAVVAGAYASNAVDMDWMVAMVVPNSGMMYNPYYPFRTLLESMQTVGWGVSFLGCSLFLSVGRKLREELNYVWLRLEREFAKFKHNRLNG